MQALNPKKTNQNLAAKNDDPAKPPKSDASYEARHRAAIYKAARKLFIEHGYDGVSMSSIVALVGGSKSTIYSYFGSKAQLFEAVVKNTGHKTDDVVLPETCEDITQTLKAFARNRLKRALSQDNIRVMRLAIAEAERFPTIGQVYFSHAPNLTYKQLITFFENMHAQNKINTPNAEIAAEAFIGPLLMRPLLARLYKVSATPKKDEIRMIADSHVDEFLAPRLIK